MKIVGYLRTSLIEWPGKIASVVFVPGCNFHCPFCHNAALVDLTRARRLPLIKEALIFADLKKRKKWVDGVVVTGGEPTLQEDLPEFLRQCKKLGFLTMIETNGSEPKIIRNLIIRKLVNFIAMDIKGPIENYARLVKYQKSNIKNQNDNLKLKIKKSIELILKSGIPFEFRTTVVPGIHDKKTLVKMARQLDSLSAGQRVSWYLQTFRPKNCLDPKFNKLKPYSKIEMEVFLAAVRAVIPGAELR